jgi:NifU-like protein
MEYSAKVLDHFLHPRHVGALDGAAAPGESILSADAGQISRGDALRIFLKLRVADETILDAKFQNFGSGLPLASGSMLCGMLIGKTLTEAARISAKDLDAALDGLPELKQMRPILALEALDAATRKFRGQPEPEKKAAGEAALCACYQVPESEIEKAVRLRKLKTVEEITAATRAGGGCHTCHPDLEEILARCARGEYRVHISPREYDDAERHWGLEAPSADELRRNPPPPSTPGKRIAADGFVFPDRSPVAELAGIKRAGQRRANAEEWKKLSHAERLTLIESVLEHDLRPALRTDGGDIDLVDLKENRVLVRLQGHCRECHSATSTLKHGVERKLQEAVWPELEVVEV